MDIGDTFATLGAELTQWLPQNPDSWLGDMAHPTGWGWFLYAVLAAIAICWCIVVRPLARRIANQNETENHTLRYLRIAVDELRAELKSLERKSNGADKLAAAPQAKAAPGPAPRPTVSAVR